MPYIIAVLALVIIGTGYALFQKNDTPYEMSNVPVIELTETNDVTANTEVSSTTDKSTALIETNQSQTEKSVPVSQQNNQTTPTTPATPATPPPVEIHTYRNGTYRAQNSYRTPEGTYTMSVTITIAADSVISASINFDEEGAKSGYSKRFNSGYQSQIVGKDLEGLNLSRVGGASLTTNAFNSALSNIRSQAS